MFTRTPILLTAAVVIVGAAGAAHAGQLAFDGFESYTSNAGLDGDNGGTGSWTGAWQVESGHTDWATVVDRTMTYSSGDITIDGGTKALAFTPDADSAFLSVGRPFDQITGTAYMSFLLQAPTHSGDDFFQMGFDPTLQLGGSGNTHASMGIATHSGTNFFARYDTKVDNSSFSSQTLDNTATYLLVLKITRDGGTYGNVRLYVNPTSLDEGVNPLVNAKGDTGISSVSNWLFRTARLQTGSTYYLDNFTLADDWAGAVTQTIPEPASIGLLALGMLAVIRRKR